MVKKLILTIVVVLFTISCSSYSFAESPYGNVPMGIYEDKIPIRIEHLNEDQEWLGGVNVLPAAGQVMIYDNQGEFLEQYTITNFASDCFKFPGTSHGWLAFNIPDLADDINSGNVQIIYTRFDDVVKQEKIWKSIVFWNNIFYKRTHNNCENCPTAAEEIICQREES
ncbi:MAG: hypothetical protein K0U40_06720 [Betaproteobacteria bacterium]|nr:hypothetical protein [Betaproteobacteria bacterium]